MLKMKYTRLLQEDYDKECKEMAQYLLGKILVRKIENGSILKGRIVETECYLGNEDKASHSYAGKRTARNEPMYLSPGTCYVYQTYGIYFCFNISSREPGAAVLLRALEPLAGMDVMGQLRKNKNQGFKEKPQHLCNGPAKLCISMDINKENCNKLDLSDKDNNFLWIEDDPDMDSANIRIVKTSREILVLVKGIKELKTSQV